MSNWFKRKKVLSAEVAALKLHLDAIEGLDEPRFPNKLDAEDNNSLNTLIYLTRAATIILALKLCELEDSDGKRAEEVLTVFHEKLYSPTSDGRVWGLTGTVKRLMEQILRLRTFPSVQPEIKNEAYLQIELWSEDWLKNLPNYDTIAARMGKLLIFLQGARTIDETNAIDKLVRAVLYVAQ